MEQQLTKAEMNCFKHGLPGERRILNGLTAVFGVSWTAVMIFVLYCFFAEWESDKRIDKDTVILAIGFVGAAVFFIVCVTCINKRNEKIYQSLKNGEYRVIISSVAAKDSRYQGSGKSMYRVDFYKCPEIKGEITPVSSKQFRHAKEGDRMKVVMIDKMHVIYGIVGKFSLDSR